MSGAVKRVNFAKKDRKAQESGQKVFEEESDSLKHHGCPKSHDLA